MLSLDAGWGTGKTAFVTMCSAWMRSEASPHSDVAVVEFNAWTQSYTGEPLKDIVDAVTSKITDADDERRKKIARLDQQAARVASGGMVPDGIGADEEGPRRDTLRFKKTLRSFVATGGGRLVVFIDELDRCRPDYATGVLEKVRHIFDVAGVVVVLAVNREALLHAVGGPHGSHYAAERYMRRFVDQATRLTDPSDDTIKKFLEHLYRETGVSSRMKRDNYTRLMFETMASPERSSLRDLEQAVHRAAFVLASIPPASDDPFDNSNPMWAWEQTAMTLTILREVNREAYRRFVSGYGDAFDAGKALRDITNWATPIEVAPHVLERMELVLLLAKRNGIEPMLNDQFWNRYNDAGREEHGKKMQELYGRFLGRILGHEPEIEHLADLIEMTAFDAPEKPDALGVVA